MAAFSASPVAAGADATFPDLPILESIELRVVPGETGNLLIKIGGPATTTNYDYIVQPGEALTISKYRANRGSQVHVLASGGTPLFAWHMH